MEDSLSDIPGAGNNQYNINAEYTFSHLENKTPRFIQLLQQNAKIRKLIENFGSIILVINSFFIIIYYIVLLYGILVQLAMIPEYLAPLYILSPLSIFFFCLVHSFYGLGIINGLIFLISILISSWVWESLGVWTGIIFGKYFYTEFTPAHVINVPLEIPFSWFFFMYLSFCISDLAINGKLHTRRLLFKNDWKSEAVHVILVSLGTGLIMVGWDMAADPMGSTRSCIWVWEHENGYFFGVPVLNFIGWFILSSAFIFVYLIIEHFNPKKPNHTLDLLHTLCPPVLYAGLIMFYVVLSEPEELGLVAFFSMGIPLIFATFRVFQVIWRPIQLLTDEYYPIVIASIMYDRT